MRKDITGNRYGKLVAIKPLGLKGKDVLWECQCDCGNITQAKVSRLTIGNKKSCGCIAIANYVGRRYGRLLVVERLLKYKNNKNYYLCKCDCGNEVLVSQSNLAHGNTNSCGCLRKEIASTQFKTHGYSKEKLYLVWKTMRKRCQNKNDKNYKHYGAKGVKVCDEWQTYEPFRKWAYENGYFEMETYTRNTIDRINPFGDYCPENCRIADWFVQRMNRRENYERERIWEIHN